MLLTLNSKLARSGLAYLSTLILCVCVFWTGSAVVACPWQDEPALTEQVEQPLVNEDDAPPELQPDLVEVGEAIEVAEADEADEAEEPNQQAAMMANMGMDPKKMQAAKRFQLTQTFQVEVEELTRTLDLESKQRKKLSIAAKGATKKLLDQWGKKRGMNQNAAGADESETSDEDVEITDADEIDEQTLMMMDMNNGNPFGAQAPLQNPIWKKMLTKVLTKEQLSTLKTIRTERTKAKKAAQIATMMHILNNEIGLSPAQSGELQQLITPHVDAAKPVSMVLYDMFLTLYYASKVDETALKKVLSDAQHQKWKLLMIPMKQMGVMLEQQDKAEEVLQE